MALDGHIDGLIGCSGPYSASFYSDPGNSCVGWLSGHGLHLGFDLVIVALLATAAWAYSGRYSN